MRDGLTGIGTGCSGAQKLPLFIRFAKQDIENTLEDETNPLKYCSPKHHASKAELMRSVHDRLNEEVDFSRVPLRETSSLWPTCSSLTFGWYYHCWFSWWLHDDDDDDIIYNQRRRFKKAEVDFEPAAGLHRCRRFPIEEKAVNLEAKRI